MKVLGGFLICVVWGPINTVAACSANRFGFLSIVIDTTMIHGHLITIDTTKGTGLAACPFLFFLPGALNYLWGRFRWDIYFYLVLIVLRPPRGLNDM